MSPRRPWDAVAWWELRRIPFNLMVLVAGLVTLLVVQVAGSSFLPKGEDAVEPALLFIAVPIYAVAANIFYTLGWATELLWSGGDTALTEARRSRIFWLGTVLSLLITLAPAVLLPVLWALFAR